MKIPLLGLLLLISLVGSPTRAEEGPVCPKTETLSRASFPEGFMFGTATAAFQVHVYVYKIDKISIEMVILKHLQNIG